MTLADRRLLRELGVVLIIKLFLIFLLKVFFFSPEAGNVEPVASRFMSPEPSPPPNDHADKER